MKSWADVVRKWNGAVAVGGGKQLRLFLTRENQPYMQLHTTKILDVCSFLCIEASIVYSFIHRLQEK